MTGSAETTSGTGCMLPAQWLKPSRTKRLMAFSTAKSLSSLQQSPRLPMLTSQSMHQPGSAVLHCCTDLCATRTGQCHVTGYTCRLVGRPHLVTLASICQLVAGAGLSPYWTCAAAALFAQKPHSVIESLADKYHGQIGTLAEVQMHNG